MPEIELPSIPEPSDLKASLNSLPGDVRYGAVRNGVATYLYRTWREQVRSSGVGWNIFQSANAEDDNLWRQWLAGTATWRQRLERTIAALNDRSGTETIFLLMQAP